LDSVVNCHVHHIYNTGIGNSTGGAGILLDSWYGFNNMHAYKNIVHHIGPASTGGSWYQGIYQTATGSIKNNIAYAVTGFGIHCWHDVNHVDIANNTSFGNGNGFVVGGGDYVHTSGPCDYMNVTNNIAFDNTGMGFDEEGQDGTHNTFTNNLSFQNGTNWRLNFSVHTADVTADPQFVNYIRTGGGDYHLKSTSPAIDKGVATYAPAKDYDDVARPQGAGYDIGAYEYKLTTGVLETTNTSAITIYPNPISASFTINISSGITLKDGLIKIYDLCGKEVKVVAIINNETTVDRGELQSGIYFYSITNNHENIGKGKLIVQ
jgi:hypothetical protein